jgi:lysyl-tRNA synthetase class II
LQYLKATSKNPGFDHVANKSSRTPMIIVESSELKLLTEKCRVLAVELNHLQDQENYQYQRVKDLESNTTITSLKIRSNDIHVTGSQALTNMYALHF